MSSAPFSLVLGRYCSQVVSQIDRRHGWPADATREVFGDDAVERPFPTEDRVWRHQRGPALTVELIALLSNE
jgi:hypothetical protein